MVAKLLPKTGKILVSKEMKQVILYFVIKLLTQYTSPLSLFAEY
jgi:hypothetical protein